MLDKTPKPRLHPLCPAWLERLLLVSWDVPATGGAVEALSLTGLLRRHLARPWRRRRHASHEETR
jgi:hypothetical protein